MPFKLWRLQNNRATSRNSSVCFNEILCSAFWLFFFFSFCWSYSYLLLDLIIFCIEKRWRRNTGWRCDQTTTYGNTTNRLHLGSKFTKRTQWVSFKFTTCHRIVDLGSINRFVRNIHLMYSCFFLLHTHTFRLFVDTICRLIRSWTLFPTMMILTSSAMVYTMASMLQSNIVVKYVYLHNIFFIVFSSLPFVKCFRIFFKHFKIVFAYFNFCCFFLLSY